MLIILVNWNIFVIQTAFKQEKSDSKEMFCVSSYTVWKYHAVQIVQWNFTFNSSLSSPYYCQDVWRWLSDYTVAVNCPTKDNHEAITVRALHPFLSRVTHIVKIGAVCWAQGHFNRRHVSSMTHLIFSWNQTCDLCFLFPHLLGQFTH